MSLLKFAVIGAGHLGRIHARLIKTVGDVELIGVVDPQPAAREAVARENGAAAFAHHDELAGQIDAAIVAAPTEQHHAVGMDLLRAGVHLLIEKPIALTVAEADELVAAARAAERVLQVGHVERFNPALAAVAPYTPRPKYIEAVRTSSYTFRSTDVGVVLDMMIHDIDLALSLVRCPVADVRALGVSIFGDHEDMAHAHLIFENGCVANLSASRSSFESQRKLQIFGERAYAGIDLAAGTARVIQPCDSLLRRELDVRNLTDEEKERFKENLFTEILPLEKLEVTPTNAILDEQRDFVNSIVSLWAEPRVPGEQGRDALEVAERVLASIAAHRWTGETESPVGPFATPTPSILPGPHRLKELSQPAVERRKAG